MTIKILKNKSGVYSITHISSGKKYIGSAINVKKRWHEHNHGLKNGNHHSVKLQRAWNKHGKQDFAFNVEEWVDSIENLLSREQHWIDLSNSVNNGFNILATAGSQLGMRRTAVTKEKMSLAKKGKKCSVEHRHNISKAVKGRVYSEEVKARMRVARSKMVVTEETRKKLSAAKIGNKNCLGRKRTDEEKAKISASHRAMWSALSDEERVSKGRKHTPEAKEKMRLAALGNKNGLGSVRTPEARAKISTARRKAEESRRHQARLNQEKPQAKK